MWIDTDNEAWVWTEQDAWDDAGNIQGPAGADGQDAESPARVIWVADDGTGDFALLSAALASITDASATKPYVIKIAPGVYTETATVALKDYVDVEGSGQGVTTIECACSSNETAPKKHLAAVVQAGAQDGLTGVGVIAEIRHLTISNTGGEGNDYSYGLYIEGPASNNPAKLFSVLHVTATADGTQSSPAATVASTGVVIASRATPQLNYVTATASYSPGTTIGVDIMGASEVVMNNVTATGAFGVNTYGVQSSGLSEVVMDNVTATARTDSPFAGNGRGFNNADFSTATILNSTLTGYTYSIYNVRAEGEGVGAEAQIANTTLDGDASGNSGLKCAAVRDENFAPLDDTCLDEGN